MDFTFETKEMALRRLIEGLGFVYGDPRIEIKPYNCYVLDMRYIVRFRFDTVEEEEKARYRAYKLREELGFDIVGHCSAKGDINFHIYFAPTPLNRFDIVVFDEKTKDVDFVISKETMDDALIAFFEHYGFKASVNNGVVTTSRGRSRISTKSWQDMFDKREYDLVPDDEHIASMSKIALFNYQGHCRITSLSRYNLPDSF